LARFEQEVLAYYRGDAVARSMARFHGLRQGIAVWPTGLMVTIVLAVAGALLEAEHHVLSSLQPPRNPVIEGSPITGGLIALTTVLVGMPLAAIAGGKVGTHFHARSTESASHLQPGGTTHGYHP
jgi:hypothetical protein